MFVEGDKFAGLRARVSRRERITSPKGSSSNMSQKLMFESKRHLSAPLADLSGGLEGAL